MKHNFDVTQFFKESNGQFSGMRLYAFIIVVSACEMALSIANGIAYGTAMDKTNVITVAGLVTTMLASALGMKAVQKKSEAEADPSDPPSTAGGPPKV